MFLLVNTGYVNLFADGSQAVLMLSAVPTVVHGEYHPDGCITEPLLEKNGFFSGYR